MLASHVIFGAYGFWLPNDPRGSWSEFVGSWDLFRYGPATTTDARHSVAARPHDRERRYAAKRELRFPPVQFTGIQARAVGRGFAEYVARSGLIVLACAVLPDHVHLVLRNHRLRVESIVIQLKGAATKSLIREKTHPFLQHASPEGRPPHCFARGEWKVFLNSDTDVRRAIRYAEQNPVKENKPPQRWSFVTPYAPRGANSV